MFMLLVALAIPLQAQDLIVTNEGDSINCKITKVKPDNIYFTFSYKDEIKNTLLPVSQIANYQKNYYSTAEVPADKIPGKEIYPHFRFAISGGWSYRTAKISPDIPSDFNDYYNKLKSGFHYDIDVSYYFAEMLGVGLRYNEFLSSNKIIGNVYVTYPDGTTEYGDLKDNIRIKFIGPTFNARFFNSTKKNCLLLEIGLGYMNYQDKGYLVSPPKTIKGNTMGSFFGVGYDLGISKNLALGFQLTLLTGQLYQYTVSDGISTQTVKSDDGGSIENLSRIDLSIGLRFNK